MTFEEALKRLAEKEPEKFQINGAENPHEDDWTQDDIDEILALIGRGYVVYSDMTGKESSWKGYGYSILIRISDGRMYSSHSSSEIFPDKLSAAKAALIAVVEREFGELG